MADNFEPKDEKVILDEQQLKQYCPITGGILRHVIGYVKAVDDISFYIGQGGTLGLVGESGCGKTTVGRTILRLEKPTSGEILFRSDMLISRKEKNELVNVSLISNKDLKKLSNF